MTKKERVFREECWCHGLTVACAACRDGCTCWKN